MFLERVKASFGTVERVEDSSDLFERVKAFFGIF